MFSRAELEAAWQGVLVQDRTAEAPDVLGWRDLHSAALKGEPVPPLPVSTYRVARRSGAPGVWTRTLAVPDPADQARYRAVVRRLAGAIEPRLGEAVTSDRVVIPSPTLRLEPWPTARRRYRLLLMRLLAGTPGAAVTADVRDCFGRIHSDVVTQALVRLGGAPADIASLEALLRGFASAGVRGLPVGPDASGVLANAVLMHADQAVRDQGVRHVRWVDDFAMVVPDRAVAGRVLEALGAALTELGLEAAQEKCRIIQGDDVRELMGRVGAVASGGTELGGRTPVRQQDAFQQLEARTDSTSDGEVVRRIRAIAARRWGSAEAAILSAIAEDGAASAPVRAWAWRALARTDPGGYLDRASEAHDERDALLQRALVSAASEVGGSRAGRLLRTLRTRLPHARATVAWALERPAAPGG